MTNTDTAALDALFGDDAMEAYGYEAGQADRLAGELNEPVAAEDGEAYTRGYLRGVRGE
jgi:hypothetical protein